MPCSVADKPIAAPPSMLPAAAGGSSASVLLCRRPSLRLGAGGRERHPRGEMQVSVDVSCEAHEVAAHRVPSQRREALRVQMVREGAQRDERT